MIYDKFLEFNLMSLKKIIFCGVIPLFLLSCAPHTVDQQLVATPDPVTLRLAEAADRAANSLDVLAAVEQERTSVTLPPLVANAPIALRRSITIDWIGPIEPIVKRLADRASYEFVTSGPMPEIPVIVNVNTRSTPIISILRDVGLQMNNRGTLKVDAENQVIEINYAQIPEYE